MAKVQKSFFFTGGKVKVDVSLLVCQAVIYAN